jgi:hypothetical protein
MSSRHASSLPSSTPCLAPKRSGKDAARPLTNGATAPRLVGLTKKGLRELVIGMGLLRGHNTGAWCRVRGIADALNVALIIVGAASGIVRRDRAPIGVASGTGFSALSFWLARRLQQR